MLICELAEFENIGDTSSEAFERQILAAILAALTSSRQAFEGYTVAG
jgi:hypothetical protein